MKFEYKGYQLELDVTLDKEGSIYWKATCHKLSNFSFCFSPGFYRSLEGAISKFKQEVDRFFITNEIEAKKNMKIEQECLVDTYLAKRMKELKEVVKIDNTSEWYYEGFILQLKATLGYERYIAECKDIGFYMVTSSGIDRITNEFRKAVDTKLQNDKEKDVSPPLSMSFLTTNGKVITVPCHILEDGTIQCEQFSENATIIGYNLKKEEKKSQFLKIKDKTFEVLVDPITKEYYCYFASLKLTGKTVKEIEDQITRIYEVFS